MVSIKRFLPLVLGLLVLSLAQPASAHGYIVRAIPENRATLERPPTRLQYWFSESLEPDFSEIHLRNHNGDILASGAVDEQNDTLMALQVPSGLPEGAYIVELRPAFASDGHVVAESHVFFVGQTDENVEGTAASTLAEPLEAIWRTLVLASASLLFGTFMLYANVLIPAWGSTKYPAGNLPPRVMARLNQVIWIGLVLAFFGNLLALIQQTMVFFDVDAIQVITQGLWQVVRIGSRFGDVWNVRVLLLMIIGIVHLVSVRSRDTQPASIRPFWMANIWASALMIGTLTVNSHASGSLIWPWVATGVNWLHSLGVGFWVGGVAALTLILPTAVKPYADNERRQVILAATRRLSGFLAAIVALVIATGIYNALNWFYTPSDLQTTYGTALFLKLLMVALLLGIGALHHITLHPQMAVRLERILTRFTPSGLQSRIIRVFYSLIERVGRFIGSLRLETVAAVIVLASVGLLSATPIPEPEFLKLDVETPAESQTIAGLDISTSIIPGGPGVNTYDTVIKRNSTPVEDAVVSLQMVNPSRDWRSKWSAAEPVDSGLFVTAGDEIDREGRWLTVIDIQLPGSDPPVRAVFDWTITDEASVIESQPPSLWNILALIGVILAVYWVLYPSLRRIYVRLDLQPASLIIAAGVIGMTIIFMIVAMVVVAENQRQYEESLWPSPEKVNPILPDEASLTQGKQLFTQYCANWQTDTGDIESLQNRLEITRDDALFAMTVDGWRDLPPCDEALTDTERWHIVNYLRTL